MHLRAAASQHDPAAVDARLRAAGLTVREAEVVRLVARGLANPAISDALELSVRTVQKHLERASRRLGVSTRSEAAALVWRT
jgi:DNA-binding NarL/FixJ family response regulator